MAQAIEDKVRRIVEQIMDERTQAEEALRPLKERNAAMKKEENRVEACKIAAHRFRECAANLAAMEIALRHFLPESAKLTVRSLISALEGAERMVITIAYEPKEV